MKKKYLTLYDYGTGGVWYYVAARSKDEIQRRFPRLQILDKEPDWFDDDIRKNEVSFYDIDDEPNEFFKEMMK